MGRNKYTCVVLTCYSREGTGIFRYFYSFPKDEMLKNQWIENLKIPNFEHTKRSRVCNRHFEDVCFVEDTLKLKKNSIPTLALGYEEPPMHALNTENLIDEDVSKEWRICCIKNCPSKPASVFHRFPTNKQLREKWLSACKIDEKDVGLRTFVCHEHFTFEYRGLKKVRKDGIPTLRLDLEPAESEIEYGSFDEEYNESETGLESDKPFDKNFLKFRSRSIYKNSLIRHKRNVDKLKDILLKQQEEIKKLKLLQEMNQQILLQKDAKIDNLKETVRRLLIKFNEVKKTASKVGEKGNV